ncbi:DUF2303 family protein [Acidovorax sp. JG5]|uniref:DUF2303 family protein n=1 Tax=Acidovorax sp. JG5 TaxID=2822718 RepID=UPI001B342C6D|nr:DUF2303 family protein [Acidovorax sp. JG5]MBP3980837.1 DUF2303 family protein [Acidovorax sp. JG5]
MNTTNTTQATEGELAQFASYSAPCTSVPDAFIEALEEGQAIHAANEALEEALINDTGLIALPSDVTVRDLEYALPNRRRARGTMATPFVTPFAQYATAYAGPGACVFVNPESMQARAVLDLGTQETPGHADHSAQLAPVRTAAYDALRNITSGASSQQTIAEFFEDWAGQVQFFNADGEITPKQAIAAVRRITIEALSKVESEEQQLSANRSAFESVTASSKEPIPTTVYFMCKPYADLNDRVFVLRLAILTGEKAPRITLRIQKLEEHTEEMATELCDLVSNAIAGAMPVLVGSYSKGA